MSKRIAAVCAVIVASLLLSGAHCADAQAPCERQQAAIAQVQKATTSSQVANVLAQMGVDAQYEKSLRAAKLATAKADAVKTLTDEGDEVCNQ